MAINSVVAPLLGSFQAPAGTGSSAAARLAQGISDQASTLFGTNGRASVPLTRLESTSPATRSLARALSGFYTRVQTARDAAATVSRVAEQGLRDNTLNADQTVTATRSLVTAINDLRSFIQANPGVLATGLLQRVDSATNSVPLKNTLASLGITFDSAGQLSLNEGVLRQQISLQPKSVASALSATSGLAQREIATMRALLGGPTITVVGFSGASSTGNFVVNSTTGAQAQFAGQFVNLFI